jgi:ABC-type polysaccharide/polyol phosphate export permease
VVWSFFSEATGQGMRLLKQKLYLLESIPFNWMDIYFSYLLSMVFGLLFNTSALMIVGAISGVYPTVQFVLFPLALILLYFFSMSVLLILSVLFPIMEDLDHLWDMVILVGFWGSGVIVDSNVIVEALPWIIYFNPIIGIIDLFRNAVMGSVFIGWDWVGLLVIQASILLGIGIWIFKKYVRLSIEKI